MSSPMQISTLPLSFATPLTVGSVDRGGALAALDPERVRADCDVLEIRLDGVFSGQPSPGLPWQGRFPGIPLLFTARRAEEGGLSAWNAAQRMAMLEKALPDAALIDVEAASIDEMREILDAAAQVGVPWIASFHDFHGVPEEKDLLSALESAKSAGAAVFKWAAMIRNASDIARLAEFQQQDHGIPVASMGMGKLAVVSRLLCAQCGSVLNYGYLGDTPTAPGQWDAGSLKRAIACLPLA
jgi:3-dehydroquinate dehydratase-1